MSINYPVLQTLMGAVDDMYEITMSLTNMIEKHKAQLNALENSGDLNQNNEIKQALTDLPPERTAALVSALIEAARLVPADVPNMEEQKKEVQIFLDRLNTIRNNLHMALEGEP